MHEAGRQGEEEEKQERLSNVPKRGAGGKAEERRPGVGQRPLGQGFAYGGGEGGRSVNNHTPTTVPLGPMQKPGNTRMTRHSPSSSVREGKTSPEKPSTLVFKVVKDSASWFRDRGNEKVLPVEAKA